MTPGEIIGGIIGIVGFVVPVVLVSLLVSAEIIKLIRESSKVDNPARHSLGHLQAKDNLPDGSNAR